MTTIHATYFQDLAKQAEKSDVHEVQRLGMWLGHAVDEVIELRERITRMTEEQSALFEHDSTEAMLAELQRRFGCRVAPVKEYCEIFETWAGLIRAKAAELEARPVESFGRYERDRWKKAVEALDTLRLFIFKSSYLGRRIYGGEKHRTRPCPVHKGVWSGCAFEPPLCGCDLAGWLPEED